MSTTEKMIADNVLKGIDEVTKKDLKNHTGETAYSECEIQEGYHDYLKIRLKGQRIDLFIYDFDWDNTPYFKLDMEESIENVPEKSLKNSLIPAIKQKISDFFFDKANQPMFRYTVKVIGSITNRVGNQK